jgi:hypothetical protein
VTALLAFLLGILVGVIGAAGVWFWFTRRRMRAMFSDMFPGVDKPVSFLDPLSIALRCVEGSVPGVEDVWGDYLAVVDGARIGLRDADDRRSTLHIASPVHRSDVRVVAPGETPPARGATRIMRVTTVDGAVVEIGIAPMWVDKVRTDVNGALLGDHA